MIKGKGQRLIPEELLKYLEALKKEYPEAVDIVEANPTLEGGEDSLESVLINGVKYAVGGGNETHLYNHHCYISSSDAQYSLDIILDNNTPLIYSTLFSALSNLYGSGINTYFNVTTKNETIYVSRAFIFNTSIRVRRSILSNISSFANDDCDTLVSDVVSQIF